jgi:uncharacterized protein with PQ loop repeat
MWQDIAMSIVGAIFAFVLIPQVIDCYNKKCKMNSISCSITLAGLVVMAICMFTLGAYYTTIMEVISAVMWGLCWYFSCWK